MVSGTLLIADAVVTLLWQEPVSAYVADNNQATLKKAFFDPPQRTKGLTLVIVLVVVPASPKVPAFSAAGPIRIGGGV